MVEYKQRMGELGLSDLRPLNDSMFGYGQRMGKPGLSDLGLGNDSAVGFGQRMGELGQGSMGELGRCIVEGVEGGRSSQTGNEPPRTKFHDKL